LSRRIVGKSVHTELVETVTAKSDDGTVMAIILIYDVHNDGKITRRLMTSDGQACLAIGTDAWRINTTGITVHRVKR
jgi:hypothetical protein